MLAEKEIASLKNLNVEREWVKGSLPIENSLVAFDLLLVMADILLIDNRRPTVKEFFASIHQYSYTAIRTHYLRFIELDLIYLSPNEGDKRIKYVVPTSKFSELLIKYLELRNSLLVM